MFYTTILVIIYMLSVHLFSTIVDESLPRSTSLNAYLRYTLGMPGTKAMCHEGGCGSCIVMVRAKRCTSGQVELFTVNSCLVLVFSCHGWEITTVEGLGNRKDGYSEVQKRIAAFNGSQCGYCTPGWVMQLTSLMDKNLTMAELENSFAGNTCRCTGFRPILDTIQSFGTDACPKLCQRVKDIEELETCEKGIQDCHQVCSNKSDSSDWSLVDVIRADSTITLDFGKCKFFKIFDEDVIFNILNKYGVDSYMLVDGNTGKGIVENFEYPRVLIDISGVCSLKEYKIDQNLIIGANVSLEDLIKIFKDVSTKRTEFAYLSELAKHVELVANVPVRKIGSIAGNLMYKRAVPTYQSDLFVLFECVGAYITIRNVNGNKTSLEMLEFIKCDMTGKLMVNVILPPLGSTHIFRSYKIMPRNQNALAIVNAAFLFELGSKNNIRAASIVYGNIDPKFVHAKNTENYMVGKNVFTDNILQKAVKVLRSELLPVEIPGEPSIECRKKLGLGLFYKCILNIAPAGTALSKYLSGGSLLSRPVSKGKSDYQTDTSLYPLNRPMVKLEAQIQAAGEARYANDLPPHRGEVFGAFVLSTVHSGEVDNIDTTHAMTLDGVIALFRAKDIPGVNSFAFPGIPLQTEDEEILATKIKYYGQAIAIIVAKTEGLAAAAAKKVKVTYKNVSNIPPVLTIDAAKKDSNRYIAGDPKIDPVTPRGNNVKHTIKGVYEIEWQYLYYLEPITCVVIPVDNGLEVYDSTQWMDLSQSAIARSLKIAESEVIIKIRRLGGAFGGKISRNAQASTACALVAKKLNVPCRFILPLQTNLSMVGKRLPCQCEYEVGVDDNGKIQFLDATIVEDKGCTNNEGILDFTAAGFPNCYNVDTWRLRTANVLTDLPTNTFARAPGTCEALSSIEHIMAHIAFVVGKDPTEVRIINMRTKDNDLPVLIETLKGDINHAKRVEEVENFNKVNRWMKMAISINVMSFPVIYYGNYSALVSIYQGDGTVTVSVGGIEMGQGLYTKAAQVCAYELGIPLEYVKIVPSYSFVAANNIFSGASIATESVCYSVIKACEVLKSRLAPVRTGMPTANWKDIIKKAGNDQIDLTSLYMMKDSEPDLEGYNAFAVAIIQTKLDVLTGRFQIVRTDILEDVGISANPLLDVGQVQGGYIQGIGYFTCEKLHFDKETGKLLSNRSLNYHVPLALDIPVEFNVKFRYNYKNPKGVLGAKTCGEMGMCTAHGVNHALRSCIMESRKDSGYDPKEWVHIPIPYDTEVILKALNVRPEEFLLKN